MAAPRKREMNLNLLCKAALHEKEIRIPMDDGVRLEARVANVKRGLHAVVLCPALPPAGNMYIPEVGVLQARLMLQGYCTVRFNFRGVGASEGNKYMRSTQRECDDVRQVARWLKAQRSKAKLPALKSIWVVGVSYGSVIGAAAAGSSVEFDGYVAVAYPVAYLWYCTGFDSAKFLCMAKCSKPKLFVWGKTDVFSGDAAMQKCFSEMPEPKEKVVLEALDDLLGHYFRSKANLDALSEACLAFFAKNLKPEPEPQEAPLAQSPSSDSALLEQAPSPAAERPKKKKLFGFF
ncbi:Alpha/Beta hydrolase protein [Pelagophyceae sp. CCMP2097]|nr:Alpha/Beta hydrolase protein [Pelagophyceae sp. CCMP2097]